MLTHELERLAEPPLQRVVQFLVNGSAYLLQLGFVARLHLLELGVHCLARHGAEGLLVSGSRLAHGSHHEFRA